MSPKPGLQTFRQADPLRVRNPGLLCTKSAARELGISYRTLEDWRHRGVGPVFRKLGTRTVRYAYEDLAVFADGGARTNTGGGRPS